MKSKLGSSILLSLMYISASACSIENDDQSMTLKQKAPQKTNRMVLESKQEQGLDLKRIDARFKLAPSTKVDLVKIIGRKPSKDMFLESVMNINGETVLQHEIKNGSRTEATTRYFEIFIDSKTGEHHIGKLEISDVKRKKGKPVSEGEIRQLAERIYKSLGVRDEEAIVTVRPLMSAVMKRDDDGAVTIKEEGRFVFIDREIGGIAVPGNRIALLVNLDGTIRHMDGIWTPINYRDSKFRSRLSKDEVVHRAIDTVKMEKIDISSQRKLVVSTYYRVVERKVGDFIVQLTGRIAIPTDPTSDMIEYNSFNLE